MISPWDPTVLKEMEKAIQASDLGFNPISDGKILRVPVPPMTEERRREVVKHLNKVLEEHRTAVRNVRRDGNDALKKLAKDKKISEDEEKRAMEEVQKMTDEEIRKMEEMSRRKEVEVMQV
jgi:ribosome recycling factor